MNLAAVATAAGAAYALGWLTRQPEVAAARREASTDALTGLINRRGLKRHLRIRANRRQSYTLYMIDLNGFKAVNDTYGHRAGDELLRQVAARFTTELPGRVVVRLGGDEFMIVDDAGRAGALLVPIGAVFTAAFPITGSLEPVILSAAVGQVQVPAGANERAAMHTADLAMYDSKRLARAVQAVAPLPHGVDESPRSRIRDARPVRVA